MIPVRQTRYWFRPKRLWAGLALYYPVNGHGGLATFIIVSFGILLFHGIDALSHSVSDTLINFTPWAIILLALFDLLCFRFGEYPTWWKHGREST